MSKTANMKEFDKHFVQSVEAELARARTKFPSPIYSMTALTEEVGELAKALLHWRLGLVTWEEVTGEAKQVAAMAQRVAVEGDPSITYSFDAEIMDNWKRHEGDGIRCIQKRIIENG